MEKQVLLQAEERTELKTRASKRLRKEGFVPAIIYGKNIDSVPIKVRSDELRRVVKEHGRNAIITIQLNGDKSYNAIIKNIFFEKMKNDLQHVDFQHVSMDEEIKAVAPIRIVGREAIESKRLVLIRQIDEVKIVGLPQDIPEHVEIDVSDMEAGDTVTIGDIKYPDGITPDEDTDGVVLTVSEPKEEAESTDDEVKEPELVDKEDGEDE